MSLTWPGDCPDRLVGMIGPDVAYTPGGMARIQQVVADSTALRKRGYKVCLMPSHTEKSVFRKVAIVLRCAILLAIRRRHLSVCHLQMATGASVERKLALSLLVRGLGLPLIVQLHGADTVEDYRNSGALHRLAFRTVARLANLVLVLGSDVQRFVGAVAPSATACVLPNGIELPAEYQPLGEEPLVAFIGRLGDRKGVLDLLEATASQSCCGPSWRLVLAGDGDQDAVLEWLARHPLLLDRVEVVGWLDELTLQDLINDAWIVSLPSYAEGMPMALLQAMANGRAVVATNVGAIPELVVDGCTGLLHHPGDISQLGEHLRRLIDDQALCARMGLSGRARVGALFSVDYVVNRLADHYDTVCQNTGS